MVPTLSLDTMRLMLVLACLHNADISALDVSGAYLSGKMDPDDAPIFLRKPDGLSQLNCSPLMPDGSEPYAFIAKSSIYGLQKSLQNLPQVLLQIFISVWLETVCSGSLSLVQSD